MAQQVLPHVRRRRSDGSLTAVSLIEVPVPLTPRPAINSTPAAIPSSSAAQRAALLAAMLGPFVIALDPPISAAVVSQSAGVAAEVARPAHRSRRRSAAPAAPARRRSRAAARPSRRGLELLNQGDRQRAGLPRWPPRCPTHESRRPARRRRRPAQAPWWGTAAAGCAPTPRRVDGRPRGGRRLHRGPDQVTDLAVKGGRRCERVPVGRRWAGRPGSPTMLVASRVEQHLGHGPRRAGSGVVQPAGGHPVGDLTQQLKRRGEHGVGHDSSFQGRRDLDRPRRLPLDLPPSRPARLAGRHRHYAGELPFYTITPRWTP